MDGVKTPTVSLWTWIVSIDEKVDGGRMLELFKRNKKVIKQTEVSFFELHRCSKTLHRSQRKHLNHYNSQRTYSFDEILKSFFYVCKVTVSTFVET